MPDPSVSDLPDECRVYRAMTREDWVEDNEDGTRSVSDAAFYRRHPDTGKDLKGISVNIVDRCTIAQVETHFNRGFWGVAILTLKPIRDLGLDVKPDSNTGNHANLTGLPGKWENKAEAIRLANRLAKMSTHKMSDDS